MIPTVQVRGIFTQKVIAVYRERMKPFNFLRSFFISDESLERFISIEVQRGYEKVAVDVSRFGDGNRNTFGRSTQKTYDPPYYHETIEMTDSALYERVLTNKGVTPELMAAFVSEMADKLVVVTDKIERAYELQCAQVLTDGIVVLNNGDNINFQRKAASLTNPAGSGGAWTTGTNDPNTIMKEGCDFIRKEGMNGSATMNVIMGELAFSAFLNNDIVKGRQSYIKDFALYRVTTPQRTALGSALHGEVSVGAYNLKIWTYPQFYTNAAGVKLKYIDDKKIIILPDNPAFKLGFGAVPQLLEEGEMPQKGAYLIQEFKDRKKASHELDIRSAGLAVPVAVDQVYTSQVVA